MTAETVKKNWVVSLEYALHLGDGEIVDSSEGEEPLVYLHGVGMIIPGLEQAVDGMALGESKEIIIEPDDAYGMPSPDNFETVSLNDFPPDLKLEEGMLLELEEESGTPFLAVVHSVSSKEARLDLNHPLAGETLHFHVEVVELRPATPGEIDHGHVHEDHEH